MKPRVKTLRPTSWTALVATIALAGCAAHFNVPSAYEGQIAVQLANRSGESVCKFAMAPEGQPIGGDWFGFKKLLPDHTIDFKLKPGKYTVRTSSCPGGWTAKDTVVEIAGPTVIVTGLHHETTSIPAGFNQAFIAIIPNEGVATETASGGGGGEEGEGESKKSCVPDGVHPFSRDECCGQHTAWSSEGKGDICCTPHSGQKEACN